jgi:hypothetical protein
LSGLTAQELWARTRRPATHSQICPIAEDEGPSLSETILAFSAAAGSVLYIRGEAIVRRQVV